MLIPAAGASRRMRGADKLMEPVAGRPVLAEMALRAGAAGAAVLVTLPAPGAPQAEARRAALAGLGVDAVAVADAAEGMAASLRAGAAAAAATGRSGLMVLLPDMPDIAAADIAALIRRFAALPAPPPVLRAAAADGRAGHPVILPARLFAALARLRGDAGARALLRGERVVVHPLAGDRALTDLDTPEAWAAWRAARR